MPVWCFVNGCTNRGRVGGKLSYHSFPAVLQGQGEQTLQLSSERRAAWITAVNRKQPPTKFSKVCSDHFISGKPSVLYDAKNPDWVPSQLLCAEERGIPEKEGLFNRKALARKGELPVRMHICCVPGCKHSSQKDERTYCTPFFALPSNQEDRQEWITVIGVQSVAKTARICSCHFKNRIRNYGPTLFQHNNFGKINTTNTRWLTKVVQSMKEMRERESLCDVKVITSDEKTLLFHSVVLAAASPVLYAAIENERQKEVSGITIRSGMSSHIWEVLTTYLYSGVLNVTPDIYSDFTALINQLQFTHLISQIEEMFKYKRDQFDRLQPKKKPRHEHGTRYKQKVDKSKKIPAAKRQQFLDSIENEFTNPRKRVHKVHYLQKLEKMQQKEARRKVALKREKRLAEIRAGRASSGTQEVPKLYTLGLDSGQVENNDENFSSLQHATHIEIKLEPTSSIEQTIDEVAHEDTDSASEIESSNQLSLTGLYPNVASSVATAAESMLASSEKNVDNSHVSATSLGIYPHLYNVTITPHTAEHASTADNTSQVKAESSILSRTSTPSPTGVFQNVTNAVDTVVEMLTPNEEVKSECDASGSSVVESTSEAADCDGSAHSSTVCTSTSAQRASNVQATVASCTATSAQPASNVQATVASGTATSAQPASNVQATVASGQEIDHTTNNDVSRESDEVTESGDVSSTALHQQQDEVNSANIHTTATVQESVHKHQTSRSLADASAETSDDGEDSRAYPDDARGVAVETVDPHISPTEPNEVMSVTSETNDAVTSGASLSKESVPCEDNMVEQNMGNIPDENIDTSILESSSVESEVCGDGMEVQPRTNQRSDNTETVDFHACDNIVIEQGITQSSDNIETLLAASTYVDNPACVDNIATPAVRDRCQHRANAQVRKSTACSETQYPKPSKCSSSENVQIPFVTTVSTDPDCIDNIATPAEESEIIYLSTENSDTNNQGIPEAAITDDQSAPVSNYDANSETNANSFEKAEVVGDTNNSAAYPVYVEITESIGDPSAVDSHRITQIRAPDVATTSKKSSSSRSLLKPITKVIQGSYMPQLICTDGPNSVTSVSDDMESSTSKIQTMPFTVSNTAVNPHVVLDHDYCSFDKVPEANESTIIQGAMRNGAHILIKEPKSAQSRILIPELKRSEPYILVEDHQRNETRISVKDLKLPQPRVLVQDLKTKQPRILIQKPRRPENTSAPAESTSSQATMEAIENLRIRTETQIKHVQNKLKQPRKRLLEQTDNLENANALVSKYIRIDAATHVVGNKSSDKQQRDLEISKLVQAAMSSEENRGKDVIIIQQPSDGVLRGFRPKAYQLPVQTHPIQKKWDRSKRKSYRIPVHIPDAVLSVSKDSQEKETPKEEPVQAAETRHVMELKLPVLTENSDVVVMDNERGASTSAQSANHKTDKSGIALGIPTIILGPNNEFLGYAPPQIPTPAKPPSEQQEVPKLIDYGALSLSERYELMQEGLERDAMNAFNMTVNSTQSSADILQALIKEGLIEKRVKPNDFGKSQLCTVCGKVFDGTRQLKAHARKVHASDEDRLARQKVCEKCGATFDQMSHLRDHEYKYHNTPRPAQKRHYTKKVRDPQDGERKRAEGRKKKVKSRPATHQPMYPTEPTYSYFTPMSPTGLHENY